MKRYWIGLAIIGLLATPAVAQVALDAGGANGGSVRIGSDTAACDSNRDGAIRFTSSTDAWEFCNGSAWVPFEQAAAGGDWVISAGSAMTCGTRGGGTNPLWCWGYPAQGRLGDGQTSTNRTRSEQVHTNSGLPGWADWVSVSTNNGHSCGIRADSTAWCWGYAGQGNVGDGQTSTDRTRPVQVHTDTGSPGWSDWTSIAAGANHTCGIRTDGSAWCWGMVSSGQVGDGQTGTNRTRPVQLHTDTGLPGWSDWKIISGGSSHSCGIRTNGTAWCWGGASSGRLGNGTTTPNQSRPVQVHTDTGLPGWSDWITLSVGSLHACGIRSDGTAWCWGAEDSTEKLGDGPGATNQPRPVQVHSDTGLPGWSDWVSITSGSSHNCGIRSDGTAWCWGHSGMGRLGNDTTTPHQSRPVQVHADTGLPGWTDWINISAGNTHTCGMRANGSLWCWGDPLDGRLGDGQTGTNRTRPWAIGAF